MQLEQRVRKAVDLWYAPAIETRYTEIERALQEREQETGLARTETVNSIPDLALAFCYGIGIKIVQNAINAPSEPNHRFKNNYLSLKLDDAVKEFRKDYLILRLAQNDFWGVETAHAIKLGKDERQGMTMISRILDGYGLKLSEIKKTPQRYINGTANIGTAVIDIKEFKEVASKEIKTFAVYTGNPEIRGFIRGSISSLSDALSKVINDLSPKKLNWLFNLDYDRDFKEFRKWYLTNQFERCHQDYDLTAKNAGKTKNALVKLMKAYDVM